MRISWFVHISIYTGFSFHEWENTSPKEVKSWSSHRLSYLGWCSQKMRNSRPSCRHLPPNSALTLHQDPGSRPLPLSHIPNCHYSAPHQAGEVHDLSGSSSGRQGVGMLMNCLSPKRKDPTRKCSHVKESLQCADCLLQPLRKQRRQSVTKHQA